MGYVRVLQNTKGIHTRTFSRYVKSIFGDNPFL